MRRVAIIAGLLVAHVAGEATAATTTGTTGADIGTSSGSGSTGDPFMCELRVDPPVWIAAPTHGSTVPSHVTVEIGASYRCYCDFIGCVEEHAEALGLWVDGQDVGSCDGCGDAAQIEIELGPGRHTLQPYAVYYLHPTPGDEVTVFVEDDPPATTTDLPSPTTGGSMPDAQTSSGHANTSGGEVDGDDLQNRGCGCGPADQSPPALALLLALAIRRPNRPRSLGNPRYAGGPPNRLTRRCGRSRGAATSSRPPAPRRA